MRKMKKFCILVCVWALLFTSVSALADVLNPPPWRGQDGSTWAQWEFSNDNPIPAPDFGANPYGDPALEVFSGHPWLDTWGGRYGIWDLSGSIGVDIPNRPEQLPYKEIWVQITWAATALGGKPLVYELDWLGLDKPAVAIEETELGATGEPFPNGQNWYHTTFLLTIEPNPPYEYIYIAGNIVVDELVIDTICIPEPATIALLGLGGLALLRRKRS